MTEPNIINKLDGFEKEGEMIEPIIINELADTSKNGEITTFDSSDFFDTWYSPDSMIYTFIPRPSPIPGLGTYEDLIRVFNIGGFWAKMKKNQYNLSCGFYDDADPSKKYTFEIDFCVDENRPDDVFMVFYDFSDTEMCRMGIWNLMSRLHFEPFKIP